MGVLVGKPAPDFTAAAVTGSGEIIDDFNLCNFEVIRAAISYWDFTIHEKGNNKVCLEKIC